MTQARAQPRILFELTDLTELVSFSEDACRTEAACEREGQGAKTIGKLQCKKYDQTHTNGYSVRLSMCQSVVC